MRHRLQPFLGQRLRFTAIVKQRDSRRGYGGGEVETVLLIEVRGADNGELLIDGIWKDAGKWSQSLCVGQRITFDATVATYKKGYGGMLANLLGEPPRPVDFTLKRLTVRFSDQGLT